VRKGFVSLVIVAVIAATIIFFGGIIYYSVIFDPFGHSIEKNFPVEVGASPSPAQIGENEIVLSDNDNGSTTTIFRGSKFKVILHNTYWAFDNLTDEQVIVLTGKPVYAGDTRTHIAGMGTGTVTAEYQAKELGNTLISASRTLCGEAYLCAANEKSFLLHVVVKLPKSQANCPKGTNFEVMGPLQSGHPDETICLQPGQSVPL